MESDGNLLNLVRFWWNLMEIFWI